MSLSILVARAGNRASANYTIPTDANDSGGAVLSSAAYSVQGSSAGLIAAVSSVASPPTTDKAGYVAQLYDVQGLGIGATPMNVNERAQTQLSAAPLLDDQTTLAAFDPATVSWSIVSGPVVSISTTGVATAGTVYQDTSATVGGSAQSLSGQFNLTILNITNDDFGPYANDGIDDSWQVQYFGLNNPNAAPNVDADGDGEDNLSEFRSGGNPTDPNSTVRTGKQLNISTRAHVLTGDNVTIGGFIITGTDPKRVIVRGIGPSLQSLGIPNFLANPTLELHQSDVLLATNDNWRDTQETEIQNTGLAPTNDAESAIVVTLSPGAYTAILAGKIGGTGVGVVEFYDLSQAANGQLANISTRSFVEAGNNVMIGGFIVGGGLGVNGAGSEEVLVRGIGPSLIQFGVSNALQDPTLELRDGNGALITVNDNWRDTQEAAIQATGLAPSDDRESAILAILVKGNYTAILRGKNDTIGVGLIEAYKVH
jgi:hypothetical protein